MRSRTSARCHIGPPKSRQLNKVFQSSLQFPILEHRCSRTGKIHWHICSLVSEWQGRELEKSSSLDKNDSGVFSRFSGAPHIRRFSNIGDIYTSLSLTQDPYSGREIRCV